VIEEAIGRNLFSGQHEKTFIDKVLARKEVEKIRELVKKTNLTRSELLELQYSVAGVEAKLANYGEWDRYVMNKFYVWLREFVKLAEQLHDYIDYLDKTPDYNITPRGELLLNNCRMLIEHNCKFLIDLYLNIARTSMSLGATGFLESMRNKFEIAYEGKAFGKQDEARGFMGMGGKK
jgi:hypothetical protein